MLRDLERSQEDGRSLLGEVPLYSQVAMLVFGANPSFLERETDWAHFTGLGVGKSPGA